MRKEIVRTVYLVMGFILISSLAGCQNPDKNVPKPTSGALPAAEAGKTVFFSDDFENGLSSEWKKTVHVACSLSLDNTIKKSGNYSCKFSDQSKVGYRVFLNNSGLNISSGETYIKFDVYFQSGFWAQLSTPPGPGWAQQLFSLNDGASPNSTVVLSANITDGKNAFELSLKNSGVYLPLRVSDTVGVDNTWYTVEIKVPRGTGDLEWWINGVAQPAYKDVTVDKTWVGCTVGLCWTENPYTRTGLIINVDNFIISNYK